MSDRRFRCCGRTQDGNFCTECGAPRGAEEAPSVNELVAFLESRRDSARQTAETHRASYVALIEKFPDLADSESCKAQWTGWERRARMFSRFLACVDALRSAAEQKEVQQ